MAKPDAKKWPTLKSAWDEYGHSVKWEDLLDIKTNNSLYVVVMWKEGDDYFVAADMERAGHDQPWWMNNDGTEPMTKEQWDRLRIPEECNWFEVPTMEELRDEEHDRLMELTKYNEVYYIFQEGFEAAFGKKKFLDAWFESASRERLMKTIKKPKKK